MSKSNVQRGKELRERKKKEKLAASPVEKVTPKTETYCKFIKCYCQISIRVHERISSMLSLWDGNAFETLLMTVQSNADLMNYPVPLIAEPSASLVSFGPDACKSIINSILRHKDYDSHKNAHKDFQKRFIDNRSIDTGVQFVIY
ncbi:uncharacterized protein TNCV_655181 [Trichonephila clavipes]|nr:uncharacterized protein TNCV_655181 [Trichonephila clavipes]